MLKLVVGVGGASGSIYAKRLLEALRRAPAGSVETALVLSPTARQVWAHEVGGDVREYGVPLYDARDFHAPFASGSAGWQAMVVIPCSMGQLARIAHGMSEDLIGRAADVMLKERRKLVLVTRETPLSLVHLENMRLVTLAGGVVLPASPSFYGRPQTLEECVDTVVGRALDQVGVPVRLGPRWKEDEA
jgi:4-hydroxy-3-polyprenylbenzoate decarboxylase